MKYLQALIVALRLRQLSLAKALVGGIVIVILAITAPSMVPFVSEALFPDYEVRYKPSVNQSEDRNDQQKEETASDSGIPIKPYYLR